MIAYLHGKVLHKDRDWCMVLTRGVGYEVFVTNKVLSILTLGEEIDLYIYTHVREDQLSLFGFHTLEERMLFVSLIGISGIGPKAALSILTVGTVEQIKTAISRADVLFFTKIKGLGKKRAQKIIIELKEKLGSLEELDLEADIETYPTLIVDALQGFGFLKKDILKTLDQLDLTQSEAQVIKEALAHLAKT